MIVLCKGKSRGHYSNYLTVNHMSKKTKTIRNTELSFTAVSLPCTEDVPTCGGTCDKPLACGRHKCTQQCHVGTCGICRQLVTKTCRCGKREKNVLCSQVFLCEFKCPKMRQCERHPCKRKVIFNFYDHLCCF